MKRRTFLIAATCLTIFVGISFVGGVFVASMHPSARAKAALPRFSVEQLEVGTLKLLEGPDLGDFGGYKNRLLAYKTPDGNLKVWFVPVKNGLIGLPDIRWWRPFHLCSNLSAVNQYNGIEITCLDENISDWWRSEWKWDITGKNLGKWVDDLLPAQGVIEGNYFVYGKNS